MNKEYRSVILKKVGHCLNAYYGQVYTCYAVTNMCEYKTYMTPNNPRCDIFWVDEVRDLKERGEVRANLLLLWYELSKELQDEQE